MEDHVKMVSKGLHKVRVRECQFIVVLPELEEGIDVPTLVLHQDLKSHIRTLYH